MTIRTTTAIAIPYDEGKRRKVSLGGKRTYQREAEMLTIPTLAPYPSPLPLSMHLPLL